MFFGRGALLLFIICCPDNVSSPNIFNLTASYFQNEVNVKCKFPESQHIFASTRLSSFILIALLLHKASSPNFVFNIRRI